MIHIKKRLLATLAFISLFTVGSSANRAAYATEFSDITGHWASSDIMALTSKGLIGGYPDGTFRPDAIITRAEFSALLVRALKLPERSDSAFPDTVGHWAAGSLATARMYRVANGYPDGRAHPDEPLTRAEMAVMLSNALHPAPGGPDFSDTSNHWANSEIRKIAGYKLMSGYPDGTFAPDAAATRAEAASVIARVLANLPKTVLGYTVKNYPADSSSLQSIEKSGSMLSHTAAFRYSVDGNGNLTEHGNQDELVAKALDQKIVPLLTVHNNFDSNLAAALLESDTAKAAFIRNLLLTMEQKRYVGVNIDLENIPPKYRSQYSRFLQDLRDALHPKGYYLSVTVPAKTSDAPSNSWIDSYDYGTIGQYADLVVVMTYDEHWFGGNPGPVASLRWVEDCLRYAVSEIPNDKLLLGVAVYGYDWPETPGVKAKAVSSAAVANLLAKYGGRLNFDKTAMENTYSYTDEQGVRHTVWIEDEQSLPYKLDLAGKYGIRGIGIWRLGLESDSFWSVLGSYWNRR